MSVQSGRGPEAGAATVGAARGPTWIEVNLENITHNLMEVKRLIGPKVAMMAVVKANAYGHGAVAVARTALAAGASALGVTTVEEGAELRRAGIRAPILVMGAILPHEAAAVIRHSLTPSIGSLAVAQALDEVSRRLRRKTRVHVKVDTGLGRLGVRHTEAPEFVGRLREFDWIEIEGIYSHFATAYRSDLSYARKQLAAFREAVARIEADGWKIPLKHMANSEALITLPESRLDMVRVGNLMYGQSPVPLPAGMELKPTWSWKARVVHTQIVPPGGGVGYGRDYVARGETVVAVLPVGLADGFRVNQIKRPVRLSELGRVVAKDILAYLRRNRFPAEVVIRGREAPVIGRVGMQTTTVDVSRIPGVEAGDVATLSAHRVIVAEHIPRIYVGAQAIAGKAAAVGQEAERGTGRGAGREGGWRREEEARPRGGRRDERHPRGEPAETKGRGEGRDDQGRRREWHDGHRGGSRRGGSGERGPAESREPRPLRELPEAVGRDAGTAAEAAAGELAERESGGVDRGLERRPETRPRTVLHGERISRLMSPDGTGATEGTGAGGGTGTAEGTETAAPTPARRPFGARKKKPLRGPKRRRHTPGKIRPS